MSNTFSKSSVYVNSLVDFTLDTKPYHSKLTEVAVEYRFEDAINVSIIDAVASRMVKKAGWLYNYYSGGDVNNRTFNLKRLVMPNVVRNERNDDQTNTPGAFKVGRDENQDMANVPYVYAKQNTAGIADAWLERNGTAVEYLTRDIDFHHSYGSMEFRVSQASPAEADQSRLWQETRAEGVMNGAGGVTETTRYLANRRLNEALPWSIANSDPKSANYRIRQVLNAIQAQLTLTPNPSAQANLNAAFAILNTPDLPQTYEALWATLESGGSPIINHPVTGLPFTAWRGEDGTPPGSTYVDDYISQNTPPAYFYALSDQRLRESGGVFYDDMVFTGFSITDIQAVAGTAADEWSLKVTSVSPIVLEVSGVVHGFIGAVVVGSAFNSSYVKFNTTAAAGTPAVDDTFLLTPDPRIVIDPAAPMEVWNLIKTDPIAHSRPVFTSTRYGSIRSLSSVVGEVTILDVTLPTGTVILTALNSTTFALSSTAEPSYTNSVPITVGTVYNDGRLGFTIIAGTAQSFAAGDKFYINIINEQAHAHEFDLYYGYDLDSYDNQTSPYENQNTSDPLHDVPLDFRFDSRFTDYNLDAMNLQIAQNAVSGYKYRLTAKPDGALINVLHSDGTTVNNFIDLAAAGGGTVPVFSMPGDANPAADISAYIADTFRLERSTDGGATWTAIAPSVSVGSTYSNPSEGISFTLVPGSKPFVGVYMDDAAVGGDVFQWTVINEAPKLDPVPVMFSSVNLPRLILHGEGFWDAPAADWSITFTSSSEYSVTAIYTAGPSVGMVVPGYPVTGSLDIPGSGVNRNLTFKNDHVHFTINRGRRGFAAGDVFRFSTYEDKPSILVHGSYSGWQEEAEIGKWYWNGKIGFKLNKPTAQVFKNSNAIPSSDVDYGTISVTRVRPDTPELVYTFTRLESAGPTVTFTVNRSDVGTIDYCPLNGTFKDQYITVSITTPSTSFQVGITADQLQFWNAQDTVIVRPQIPAMVPTANDFFAFKKAHYDRLGINLEYANVLTIPDTAALGLTAVDPAYIDISTGGVPIQAHSPEAIVFSGWMPLKLDGYDAVSSIAHFPDEATEVKIRSAVSGESVGRIYSEGTINEPIRFEWDSNFFAKYLPLNASSNVMLYNSFMNENVRVLISERINFIQSGGVLLEDAMFNDDVVVNIAENHDWSINLDQHEDVQAAIADGPFGGFLAGYDNLQYELETSVSGQFDTGSPLTDNFLRAKFLSTIASPTTADTIELATLTALVNDYLVAGSIADTSLNQFLAALDADPYDAGSAPTLGIPTVGAAIDINENSTSTAAASMSEAMSLVSVEDANLYDEEGFDMGGLDTETDSTAILLALSNPPIPTGAIPGTYADLNTPLYTSTPVYRVEVSFANVPPTTPSFQIWTPAMISPLPVVVVEQLSSRRWRFSLATESEAKVIVT